MQLSNLPDYRAHLSRHGHNLSHTFDFTSSTGHLLTVFAQTLNPKERLKGHIDLFSRTQPLVGCPNVDIEEYIDYFFVPYEMLWSGFGDSLFQVNEPYSSMIQVSNGTIPVFPFDTYFTAISYFDLSTGAFLVNQSDHYGLDLRLISQYRNLFHNFINPNVVFLEAADELRKSSTTKPQWLIPSDFFQPNIFPDVLAAYNCVYQNFYRLDDREQFDATQYNIDSVLYDGDDLDNIWSDRFFDLKYRPRRFDYFTAGSVAPLINPINLNNQGIGSSLLNINNYLANVVKVGGVDNSGAGNYAAQSSDLDMTGLAGTGINYIYSGVGSSAVSTNGLRSMFAVEKLLSVTNRSKKTYDAQVMAHFGVPVPKDVKHQLQFIGQQKGMIHVGEVIATAGTEDNSLGDIAGKGYGNVSNKDIDFVAPCHGIVIGIFSCVPRVRYYAPLIKQWTKTNRLDFYFAEFEHLGMQPIYQWEACAAPNTYVYKGGMSYVARTHVLGWQMRYQQYKQQIDRVSPAFAKTLFQSYDQKGSSALYAQGFNSWSSWVISQRPYDVNFVGNNGMDAPLRSYLAGPCMLNDIMAIQYPDVRQNHTEGGVSRGGYFDAYSSDFWKLEAVSTAEADRKSFAWNTASLFYRDPLLHFAKCNFKLVSLMSDNTLPELAAV